MAFTAVGSTVYASGSSITLNPTATGNFYLVTVLTESATVYATGLSGGNCTWTALGTRFLGTAKAYYLAAFIGTATATGSSAATITFSGTAPPAYSDAHQFSSSAGAWTLDVQGTVDSASTASYPALTAAGAGELYWGYAWWGGTATAGSTSGFTYYADGDANGSCYNTSYTSGVAPVWGATSAITGLAVLLQETGTNASAGLARGTGTAPATGMAQAGLAAGNGATQAPDLTDVIGAGAVLAGGTGTAGAAYVGSDAALSGSGSLNAAPAVTVSPRPGLSGTGSLSATGTVVASSGVAYGVYRGPCGIWAQDGVTAGGAQSGITAYAAWLGRKISYVLDYVTDAPASWAQFTSASLDNGVAGFTALNGWGTLPAGQVMMLALPACCGASAGSGGATWAAESAGTNDTYWTALGNNLVSWGYGNAVLRIGREFNGSLYPWCPAVTGDPEANYIAGYQHIVTLLRGIAGSSFTFMWNPGLSPGTMSGQPGSAAETQNWYPGSAYVDCIGLDAYDQGNYPGQAAAPYGSRTTAQQNGNWSYLQSQQDGFASWSSFAFSNGKALALPEWGLVSGLSGGLYYGGGDDPYYIQQMYAQMPGFFMQAMGENLGAGLFDTDADPGRTAGMQAPDASRTLFLLLFGTQYAPLSGSGILSGRFTGTWKSSAGLAGTGTIYTLATGGLVFGSSISTPYSYPLSSQVMVAPPGSKEWVPLGSLGVMTALTYSFTCPGGADQMTATLMVPAAYRTQLFDPGWQVKITRGGHQVWDGKLDEGVTSSAGWALTASGTGNRGTDYLAVFTSTWPASEPDQAINNAITRGMPWTNPGVGTPSGAWYGQAVDSGAQTITALLNLLCTRGALTWMVNSQPGGLIGDDLNVFPLPTVPNRLLTCTSPVPRTLGGDINTIWIRYEISADTSTSAGSNDVPAVYGLTSVSNPQSVAAHQVLETFIDLSDAGVMTQAAAQAVGTAVLAIYQRASFAGPFTASYGQLMNTGGVPIDPGTDQAGTVMKLILTDFGFGGEVTPQFPLTFITGAYEWDDFAQQATITPYQSVDTSLQGLLSLAGTILTPIAAAGG